MFTARHPPALATALVTAAALAAGCSVDAKRSIAGDAGPPDAPVPPPDAAPGAAPDTAITGAPAAFSPLRAATFAFTATVPGATFLCSLDGAAPVPCTSPWTRELPDGAHAFAVRAVEPTGTPDATPAEHVWTIDTAAPGTTLLEAPPAADNSTEVVFRFRASEEDAGFECALDGAAFAACESGAPVGPLGDGAHAFAVRARDRAGNVDPSPVIHAWSVDTGSPDTQLLTGPVDASRSTTALFTFVSPDAGAGATFTCALDGGAFAACTSPHQLTGLAMGPHTFAVRVRDAVGNVDPTPATRRWTVDVAPPETTIASGPEGVVASASAAIAFTASEAGASFACSVDGAASAPCTSPLALTGLAEGAHAVRVVATDAAGNADPSPALRAWTVDTVAPALAIVAGPDEGAVVGPRVVLAFTASEGEVTCRLDGTPLAGCASPLALNLPDGVHTLALEARDAAGNVAWRTRSFTVDCHPADAAGALGRLHLDDALQELGNAVPGGAPAVLGATPDPELADPIMSGGRYGGGLRFVPEEGDHVAWPLAAGEVTAMTLELYARPDVVAGPRELLATGDGRVALRVSAASATTVQFTLAVVAGNGAPVTVTSAPVAAGRWHHVVASWQEPGLTLWVDGARTDMPGLALGAPVRLDAVRLGGTEGTAYAGELDEVWLGGAPSDDAFALGRYCPSLI